MTEFSKTARIRMGGSYHRPGHDRHGHPFYCNSYGNGYTIELLHFEPPANACSKCGHSTEAGYWVARIEGRPKDDAELRLTTVALTHRMEEFLS